MNRKLYAVFFRYKPEGFISKKLLATKTSSFRGEVFFRATYKSR